MSISPDPAGLSSPAQYTAFVDATLAVRQANAVGEEWIVTKAMKYKNFTVPDGSRSDFASVPRFLVWLIPRYGRYTKSAVLHDHLCRMPADMKKSGWADSSVRVGGHEISGSMDMRSPGHA
ncbi:DUF1353 domain-containing protein [Amycolatopsis balhimycina DSM 5908]|uniref:DUF1353 domain-containing protein n=1 Tax=Amycolatopsis balhimycina DSM 5908 TaxID=1081091 RepID=A0A428VUU7_AMYBA|nr:DUF1353 domain-containing protein [Amycolatopsis balhimycina]RSM34604.1 DUF1353 domain-containing protein [Amycolatopsis balhimycina DSM 5908]